MSETTPYASPKSSLINETSGSTEIKAIKQLPRFTTWAVVGLAIITMGLYLYYWLYSRTKKLNMLIPENPISSWLPITTIVGVLIYYVLSFMPLIPLLIEGPVGADTMDWLLPFAWALNVIIIVLFLMWTFGFRNRLNQITGAEKGDVFWLGPILTFFLNLYYFQYKINQMHDKG